MILIINFNSKGKSYIELLTSVVQHHFFTLLDYWLTRHGVDSMICAHSISSLSRESTSLFFFVCVLIGLSKCSWISNAKQLKYSLQNLKYVYKMHSYMVLE